MSVITIVDAQTGDVVTREMTSEEASEHMPSIEAQRADAALSVDRFCLTLLSMGILPKAEAVEAARGKWPDTFASFTDDMTDADAAAVEIKWARAQSVQYDDPLLTALADDYASENDTTSAAVLDAIFGIS